MSIKIDLSPEVEQQLQRYSAREGKSPEQLVQELLNEKFGVFPVRKKLSREEFAAQLEKIIKLHPQVDHFVDDSRESIYEGRGE